MKEKTRHTQKNKRVFSASPLLLVNLELLDEHSTLKTFDIGHVVIRYFVANH
ncbi:MAG: hypothetical protein ACFFDJ_02595 [Candidatus Odinarchaeota archaeon]